MLYDYNKDGKSDLFIGTEGEYVVANLYRSHMEYYENVSAGSNAGFRFVANDFLNHYSQKIQGTSLAVSDPNHDGKYEMVLGNAVSGATIYNQSRDACETVKLDYFSYFESAI